MFLKVNKIINWFVLLLFLWTQSVYALPLDYEVVEGEVTFDQVDENTLNITASDNSIINYSSFNIAENQVVNFLLPDLDAYSLNRVTGGGTSQILGTLTANGNLILINTDGFHFGESALVDVGGLIASTHNITDANFLAGNFLFAGVDEAVDGAMSSILNEGSILTREGGLALLIADAIENTGSIEAPMGTVALAAGNLVTVGISNDGMISIGVNEETARQIVDEHGNPITEQIKNSGSLISDGGRVSLSAASVDDLFSSAINTSGLIRSDSVVVGENGTVEFVATGAIELGGDILAEGADIEILSSGANGEVVIAEDALIRANGGTIKIEVDSPEVSFDNVIENRGTIESSILDGKGGFVEWVSIGANENSGTINAEIFDERGYTFRNTETGYLLGGNAYYHNLDGAAFISGNIGSNQTDTGDLIVNGNITLTANNLTFTADSDNDGTGMFDMNAGTQIDGSGSNFNLTLQTGENSNLRTFVNMGNLTLQRAGSNSTPTYTANNSMDINGNFTIDTSTTFTQNNQTINLAGDWTSTAGTFNEGGTVVFDGNNSNATIDVSTTETFDSLTINKTGSTRTLTVADNDTVITTGTLTLTDGLLAQSTVPAAGTIAARGAITQGTGFDGGNTATLMIDGTGNQTFTGSGSLTAGSLPKININKSGGTLTLASTIRATNDWTYTQGTLDAGTSTVVFAKNANGSAESNDFDITGTHTLNNVTISNQTGSLTFDLDIGAGTTLNVGGTLTFDSTDIRDTRIDTGTIAAQGDITIADDRVYGDVGTATLLINGTGNQTLTGNGSLTAGSIGNVQINKTGGTLDLVGNIRAAGDWTYTQGTIDAGTSTVAFIRANGSPLDTTITGSHTLNNVQFRNEAGPFYIVTIAGGTTLTASGDLTIDNTSQGISIDTGTLVVEGDVDIESGGVVNGSSTLRLAGGNNQDIDLTGVTDFLNLDIEVNKSGGIATLSSNLTMDANNQDLTIIEGTLDVNGQNLAVNGTGSTFTIQDGGVLELFGAETISTPTLQSGSTIRFTGDGDSGIDNYDITNFLNTYEHLEINSTDGTSDIFQAGDTLTINDDFTIAANTIFDLNAQSLTVSAGSTTFSNEGTFRLEGTEGITNLVNDTDSGTWEYIGDGGGSTETLKDFGANDYFSLVINDTNAGENSLQLGADLNVDGSITFSDGTLEFGSRTVNLAGDFTISGDANFQADTSNVIFDGTTNLTSDGHSFQDVTIGAGGTLITVDNLDIGGNFAVLNGGGETFDISNDTVNFHGNVNLTNLDTFTTTASTAIFGGTPTNLTSNGFAFNHFTIDDTGSVTTLDDLDINGNFSVIDGSGESFNISDDTVRFAGNADFSNLDTYTDNGSTLIIMDGSGTSTLTSDTNELAAITIDGTSKTVQLGDELTTDGLTIGADDTFSLNGQDFIFTAAAAVDNSGTFRLQGNETLTSVNNLDNNSGTVEYVGRNISENLNIKDFGSGLTSDYFNLTINDANANKATFRQTATLRTAGDITITSGTLDSNTNAIQISGNWSNSDTYLTGATNVVSFDGTGAQTIDSGGTGDGNDFYGLTVNKSSGTLTVINNDLDVDQNFFMTDGTFAQGTRAMSVEGAFILGSGAGVNFTKATNGAALTFDGTSSISDSTGSKQDLGNVVISNSTRTLAQNAVMTNLTINAASTFDQSTRTLSLGGNLSVNATGDFTKSSNDSALTFNGTGTSTIDSGGDDLGDITIDGTSKTVQLTGNGLTADTLTIGADDAFSLNGQDLNFNSPLAVVNNGTFRLQGAETLVNVDNLDVDSGTVEYVGDNNSGNLDIKQFTGVDYFNLTFNDTNASQRNFRHASALDVNGNLTITSGTLDSNANNINVAGNWTNNGTYVAATSTVTFDGGDQSINGSTSFFNFTKNDSSDNSTDVTLTFDNTATQTINGTLTLGGIDADDRVNLVSDSPTDQWSLDCDGCTSTVTFADVTDSDASAGNTIAHTNTVNGGNNLNWGFAITTTWTGALSSVWSLAGNWNNGTPGASDTAIIADVATDPTLDTNVTVTNLTINSGGVLSLAGFDLTVSGTFSNEGTVRLQGNETTVSLTQDIDSGIFEYIGRNIAETLTIKDFGATDYFSLVINDANANEATFQLGANANVDGTLTLTDGTLDLDSRTLNQAGDFTIGANGTLDAGTSNVVFDGTTNLTSSGESFNDVTIGAGGSLTTADNMDMNGHFSVLNGGGETFNISDDQVNVGMAFNLSNLDTFTTTNSTVVFDGSNSVTSAGLSFNNVTVGPTAVVETEDDIDINGNFSVTNGGGETFNISDDQANFAGNVDFTNLDTFTTTNSTVVFDGTTNLTSDGTVFGDVTLGGGGSLTTADNMIIGGDFNVTNGGGETLNISDDTLTFRGSFANFTNLDTFTTTNSTVSFDTSTETALTSAGVSFNDVVIGSASAIGHLRTDDDLDVNGNLSVLNGGQTSLNISGDTARFAGNANLTNLDTYLDDGSSSIVMDGSGTSTLTSAGNTLAALTVDGTSKTVQLGDALTVDALTIGADDTFSLAGQNFGFTAAAAVSNNGTFRLQGNETLTNVNDLDTNSGTVEYVGRNITENLALKTFGGAGYYNLTINDANANKATFQELSGIFVAGDLTLASGTLDGTAVINVSGNWSNTGGILGDGTIVMLSGSGNQTIDAGGTGNDKVFEFLVLNKTGGTVTVVNSDLKAENLTVTGTTFDQGTQAVNLNSLTIAASSSYVKSSNGSALTFEGGGTIQDSTVGLQDLGNVVIAGSTQITTANSNLEMTGLTINSGNTFSLNGNNLSFSSAAAVSNSGTFELHGDETLTNVNNLDVDSGTVLYSGGSGTITIKDFGATDYFNLTLNDADTTLQQAAAMNVDGNLTITSGTLDSNGEGIGLAGNWANSGTYISGLNTISLTGNGNQTIDTGGTGDGQDFNDLTLFKAGGTVTVINNDLDVDDDLFVFSNSIFDQGLRAVTIGDSLGLTSDATYTKSSNGSTLTFDGATGGLLQDLTAGLQDFGNVVIGGTNNTVTLSSNIEMTNLTINSGNTFDLNGNNFDFSAAAAVSNNGTFRLQGNETLTNVDDLDTNSGTVEYVGRNIAETLTIKDFGPTDYFNLTINDANANKATFQQSTAMTVTGNIDINSGTLDSDSNTIALLGNWTNDDTYISGNSLFLLSGIANQTIDTGGVGNGQDFFQILMNKTGGTVSLINNDLDVGTGGFRLNDDSTFDQGTQAMFVEGSFVLTDDSTFIKSSNGSSITLNGTSTLFDVSSVDNDLGNIVIDGNGTRTFGSSVQVTNLTINNGSTLDQSTSALNVGGNLSVGATATFTKSSNDSALTFNGTGTSTIDSGGDDLGDVTIDGTAKTIELTGNALTVDSLTIGADDTFSLAGQNFSFGAATAVTNNGTFRLQGNETLTNVNNLDTDSGTVLYSGGSGTITIKDFGAIDYFNLTLNDADTTLQQAARMNVDGNLTITSGTLDANSQNIDLAGNWSNSGTYLSGTTQVMFNGTGAQTVDSGGTGDGNDFYNFVVSKNSGTLTVINNDLDIDQDLIIFDGTMAQGTQAITIFDDIAFLAGGVFTKSSNGSTLTFDGTGIISDPTAGLQDLGNVVIDGSSTRTLTTDVEMTNLTINNGSTFDLDGFDFDFSAAAAVSNSGTFELHGDEMLTNVNNLDTDSGTVLYSGGSGTITIKDFGGNDYFNLTLNDADTTLQQAAALNVDGNLTITSGTLDSDGNNINLAGNWANSGTYTSGSNTVTLDGSGIQTIDSGGNGDGQDFYNLTISSSVPGTPIRILNNALDVDNDLTVTSGTFEQRDQVLNVAGNFSLTSNNAGFTKSSNASALTFDGNGTLADSTVGLQDFGNVVIDGNSLRTLSGAVEMTNLTINNGSTFDLAGNNFEFSAATAVSNSGTFELHGDETLTNVNNLDVDSGTVLYSGGSGTITIKDFGATDYFNLTLNDADTILQQAAIMDVEGNLTITSGTLDSNSNNLNVGGNWSNADTYLSGANSVSFKGTGNHTIDSGGIGDGNDFHNILITGAGGTYTLQNNDLDIDNGFSMFVGEFAQGTQAMTLAGGLTVGGAGIFTKSSNGSTLTIDGSTNGLTDITAGGQDFGNVVMGGTNSTTAINSNTIMTNLTINNGNTFTLNGNNLEFSSAAAVSNEGTFRMQGGETLTNVTNLDVDSGTVELVGTNTGAFHALSDFGATDYNNLFINDQNGTLDTFQMSGSLNVAGTLDLDGGTLDTNGNSATYGGLATVDGGAYAGTTNQQQTFNGGLTVSSGTYTAGATSVIDINGDFTQDGGTFTAPGGTGTFTVSEDFRVTGGTFNHNNGDVTFDTTATSILDAPAGGLNFFDFTAVTPGKTLLFTTGDTFNVLSPNTMTVTGSSGNNVTLNSTGGGQFNINTAGNNVSHASINNANNTGVAINCTTCTGSGNTGTFNLTNGAVNNDPVVEVVIDDDSFTRIIETFSPSGSEVPVSSSEPVAVLVSDDGKSVVSTPIKSAAKGDDIKGSGVIKTDLGRDPRSNLIEKFKNQKGGGGGDPRGPNDNGDPDFDYADVWDLFKKVDREKYKTVVIVFEGLVFVQKYSEDGKVQGKGVYVKESMKTETSAQGLNVKDA